MIISFKIYHTVLNLNKMKIYSMKKKEKKLGEQYTFQQKNPLPREEDLIFNIYTFVKTTSVF